MLTRTRLATVAGAAIAVVASIAVAPTAAASAVSLCDQIGGQWNGQYCHASVTSDRNAVREINIAIPTEVDNPAIGGTIAGYLTDLMNNWRTAAKGMAQNSRGEANFEVFHHGNIHTVLFHETYNSESTARLDGPAIQSAYRTFAFDSGSGRQVQLADVVDIAAIPSLGAPYIQAALDQALPPHQPNTYPFIPERWTPDKVYSGGYKAWALTPDELILYMPDYPVARDTPIDFTQGQYIWSMTGGMVQPHIPLSALGPALHA
ncbi:MAG: mannan-binding protein [Mycobacterium sp.]